MADVHEYVKSDVASDRLMAVAKALHASPCDIADVFGASPERIERLLLRRGQRCGEFVPLPDGRMAVKWPTVYIQHTDAIPSDGPAPMGVPITALDKGIGAPGGDFRIVKVIDGDGFVDGKNVYRHIVIVNEALRARLRKQGAGARLRAKGGAE